jgi:hypothetical protein
MALRRTGKVQSASDIFSKLEGCLKGWYHARSRLVRSNWRSWLHHTSYVVVRAPPIYLPCHGVGSPITDPQSWIFLCMTMNQPSSTSRCDLPILPTTPLLPLANVQQRRRPDIGVRIGYNEETPSTLQIGNFHAELYPFSPTRAWITEISQLIWAVKRYI